jgi:hypothetical protein
MQKKWRNWLLAGAGIALFVLGTPLAQKVAASAGEAVAKTEKAPAAAPEGTHSQAIRVGDRYLRILPTKDGSLGAFLYDSAFRLIAANENEAALTFALPNGEKQTIKITAPVMSSTCSMEEHSGEADCCAPSPGGVPHENCDHEHQAPHK